MNTKKYLLLLLVVLTTMFAGCTDKNVQDDIYKGEVTDPVSREDQPTEVSKNKPVMEERPETTYPFKLIDSLGKEITIEEEPKSCVVLGPNLTEMVYKIKAGERIVGVTDYDNFPEDVSDIEKIGGLQDPNIEKIVELNPDIVLASTHVTSETIEKLEGLGLKVISLYEEESFDGVFKMINSVGQIFNNNNEAAILEYEMHKKMDFIKEAVEGQKKSMVYYVVGIEGGNYTATGETFLSKLIEMAGAENAASDATGWSYSIEKLVEKDPDIIIVPERITLDMLKEKEHYKDLTAVKEEHVYAINEDIFVRQGPRLVDALDVLARIVHPEQFK